MSVNREPTIAYLHTVPEPNRDERAARKFPEVRGIVVAACREYGSVGPQLADLNSDAAGDPDFYVVDDQYGDELRIHVEPKPEGMTASWLRSLATHLGACPSWDVLVFPGHGVFLRVRHQTIDVVGWSQAASDLASLLSAMREYLSTLINRRDQALRRRRNDVRAALKIAWSTLDTRLVLVAAFATRSDGSPGDSVWLLHRDDRSVLDLDRYELDPDAVRPSVFWAHSSGEIAEYVPGSPALDLSWTLVAEWALVSGGQPVRGCSRLYVRKEERVWSFDLASH